MEEKTTDTPPKVAPKSPMSRVFALGVGENPHFKLYSSIQLGVGLGLFPLGLFTLVIALLWVFQRNFRLLTLGIAALSFVFAQLFGIPPLHPIGAALLDNGPQGLFEFFATTPLLSAFRIHEYTTAGALVFFVGIKVMALLAARKLSARYWPNFEGPSFIKAKHFSLKNIVLLPAILIFVLVMGILVAPIYAEDAVRDIVAQNFEDEVQVELKSVSLSLLSGELEVTGLKIYQAEAAGGKKLVSIDTMTAQPGLGDLMAGRFEVESASVEGLYLAPVLLMAAYEGKAPASKPSLDLSKLEIPKEAGKYAEGFNKFVSKREVRDLLDLYDLYKAHVDSDSPVADDEAAAEPEAPTEAASEASLETAPKEAETPLRRYPSYIENALAKTHGPAFVVKEISVKDVEVSFAGVRREEGKPSHYLGTAMSIKDLSSDGARLGLTTTASAELFLDSAKEVSIQFSAALSLGAKEDAPMIVAEIKGKGLGDVGFFGDSSVSWPVLSIVAFQSESGDFDTEVLLSVSNGTADHRFTGGVGALYTADGDIGLNAGFGGLPLEELVGENESLGFNVSEGNEVYGFLIGPVRDYAMLTGPKAGEIEFGIRAMKLRLLPKSGESVFGIPSEQFCKAYNATMVDEQAKSSFIFGYSKAQGFELKEPGTKSIIYGIAEGFEFDAGQQGTELFGGANFKSSDKGQAFPRFQLRAPEGWRENTGKREGLENLELACEWANPMLHPVNQPQKIHGLPASQVVYIWNNFVEKQGGKIAMRFRLFDEKGEFSPMPIIDFKKLVEDAAKSLGVEDIFNNPQAFMAMLGKDEGKLGKYTAFLDESGKGAPGFGAADKEAIKEKIGKAVKDKAEEKLKEKIGKKLPKGIPNPFD